MSSSTLGQALLQVFPTGNEWARRALSSLGSHLDAETPVVSVATGFASAPSGAGVAHSVEALFVLTTQNLGIAQDVDGAGGHWIALSEVCQLDALEPSGDEVHEVRNGQRIELRTDNGATVAAEWPTAFSDVVVSALQSTLNDVASSPRESEMVPAAASKVPSVFASAGAGSETSSPSASAPANLGTALDEPPMIAGGWPSPIENAHYVSGHPAQPKRRKGVTLACDHNGFSASSLGRGSMNLVMGWNDIASIDVVGSDEAMFISTVKIDSNASAIVVGLHDGSQVFFEVKSRRPPTVRAALDSVITLVSSGRVG